ncbi:MAG: MCE family protein [Sulfitobacter sp.]|nr:MCE family protein [Sulfitobacter sp.]
METRANFILIGAFTIAGMVGILAFFMWFARVELNQQFDYYDIRFSSVAGLGNASDVRFSGLPVGQVTNVRLSPNGDGTILVRIEVDAETPVRVDSIATIEAQGVTGVSYVGIEAGDPSLPLLEPTEEVPVPEIKAGRSALQSLFEDAPRLLESSLLVIQDVSSLLGEENRDRIESILTNIEAASSDFATTLEGFSAVTNTVADFTEQISQFNETLGSLTDDLTVVLEAADTTLVSIGELSEQGKGLLDESSETLKNARAAIARTEDFITDDLTLTTDELRQTSAALRDQMTTLSTDARNLMSTLGTTGETATARLKEARGTLEAADALIVRLDEAARTVRDTAARIDTVVEEDAGPLITETRTMITKADSAITSITTIATDDLPAIIAEVRTATESSRKVIVEVGENLVSSSQNAGEVLEAARGTLEDASVAFANANDTLAAINGALETGDRALDAAERAFSGADRVINEDLAGIVDRLESTLETLNTAIGQVSDDLPEVSADLRAASQSASETFAELRRVTQSAGPSLREFASTALPLYTRLAQESRTLVANLDRLTKQIQRDPTRFFLNRSTPEFRR